MLNLEVASQQPISSAAPRPPVATSQFGVPPQPRPNASTVVSVGDESSDRFVAWFAVGGVVIVALTGVIVSFLIAGSKGLAEKQRQEVTVLQQQLRTGPVATKLKAAQTVQQQLATVSGFLTDAIAWPALLDELAAILPSTTKLTNVTVDADKSVRLEGEVASQQDVATFMAALDESPLFGKAVLNSVTLNESVDGSVVIFSLVTQYVPAVAESTAATSTSGTPTAPGDSAAGAPTTATGPVTESTGPDAGGPDGR